MPLNKPFLHILLLFLSILFVSANGLLMATSVRNYTINPLNRVVIYFDKLPETITESQSDDKKQLSVSIGEVSVANVPPSTTSAGIIQSVSIGQSNNITTIILSLSEARGYNISRLPWSQAIQIEVFDWNKLDSAEDAYRTGLLSLVDNDNDLAAPYLLNATNGNHADASFFLGLINLYKGKINTAHKLFQFAEVKSTSINDNYAALAQVYAYKKQQTEVDKYNNLYKSKLPPNLSITPTPVLLPAVVEQGELADAMPYLDSIIALQQPVDTATADTLSQDSTAKDTTQTAPPAGESIWEAENYLLVKYVAGVAVAAVLLLVYLYLKWRNKQLLQQQQQQQQAKTTKAVAPPAKSFNQVIEAEQKKQVSVAPSVSPPAKAATPANKTMEEMIAANLSNPAQHKAQGVANYKKNADNLLSLIDNMKSEDVIKSDAILKAELSSANMNAGKAAFNAKKQMQGQVNVSSKNTANIELANRLVNEQKRIQQEKLAKLNNASAIKPEKIKEIAQKIGIDKGSIETKQHLEKLIANEQEFEKLSAKFGIKQNRKS